MMGELMISKVYYGVAVAVRGSVAFPYLSTSDGWDWIILCQQ